MEGSQGLIQRRQLLGCDLGDQRQATKVSLFLPPLTQTNACGTSKLFAPDRGKLFEEADAILARVRVLVLLVGFPQRRKET